MVPISTAVSHLPVRNRDVSTLTVMQISLHEIVLESDLFLVSFILLNLDILCKKVFELHGKPFSANFALSIRKAGA